MKQILFHCIYLSIIAFLGFNYWSNVQAFKAFGHLNQQLNVDAKQLDKLAEVNYKIIEEECLAYPNSINKEFLNKTEMVIKISNSTIDFIRINKSALHLDSINSLNYEHNSPNNSFLNDAKIAEIKNNLMEYRNNLMCVVSDKLEQ
jgi:hypothetical protein